MYSAEFVRRQSDMICSLIKNFALTHQFDFIDTRRVIWAFSARELIHGPLDWIHFNQKGSTVLSEAIIRGLSRKGE